MDDNARLHRSRAVTAYLQSETVTSVPWQAMSPDLSPINHIWEPPVQNIRQLEATLHRETPCQTFSSMSVCQQWTFNGSP
jgi:hypothetical protein